MAKVLFARSSYELVTFYLSEYLAKGTDTAHPGLIEYAKQQGHTVTDLYDSDPILPDTLPVWEEQLQKINPDIVVIAAHGNENFITCQNEERLIVKGINESDLKGRICLAWSCMTAVGLGPAAKDAGCPAYFGYVSDWTFLFHPDYQNNPTKDPYARAFFDAGLTTGYAILSGKTPSEVYKATIDRYNYWFDYWEAQNDPMSNEILNWLNWDRSAFTAITATGLETNAIQTPEHLERLQEQGIKINANVVLPIAVGIPAAIAALWFLTK
jgi:hypothetical protein